MFCSHLEKLIQQLYTVSEKMELLAAPTVDLDSVKSTLADYQSFQREVSSHQPLTSCVLHTGQLLLSCINTTSSLLRDALLLIERQSGVLQTHNEHFLSSIVSAMDSLTQPSQPSPLRNNKDEDFYPVEVRGSGSWRDCRKHLVVFILLSWKENLTLVSKANSIYRIYFFLWNCNTAQFFLLINTVTVVSVTTIASSG